MGVNAIPEMNATDGAAVLDKTNRSLGKDAFLKLLVTQLQYQDPLKPADSTEFTAQLAQFSSLEQLNNVNENLNALKLYQASINNAQAVGFIGKEIVSRGNGLDLTGGQPVACEVDLAAAAKRVVVTVYDSTGGFVADFTRTGLAAGRQSLAWNGRDRNGNPAPDGMYTFEVQAEGADGTKIAATHLTRGKVTGVTFDGQTPILMVGGRKVAFGDVLQVSEAKSVSLTPNA